MSSLIRTSAAFTAVCASPRLFAAYHVLLRLPVPRHPPYALCHLTFEYPPLAYGGIFSSLLLIYSREFSLVSRFLGNCSYYPSRPPFRGRPFPFITFLNFVVFSRVSLLFSFQGARISKESTSRSLVENKGFEPLTPCVQGRCSPS